MNKKNFIRCLFFVISILECLLWANATGNKHPKGLTTNIYFSDLNSGIDENKFSALCQFWINKVETEYGYKLRELSGYTLFSVNHYLAIFRFDKLQFSCSYQINPKFGEEEHNTYVTFRFYKKEDADQFANSKFITALKKKKTTVNILTGAIISVENYPFEKEDAYNSIYSGKTDGFSFNVRKALDSVTQKALRLPVSGENMLAAYRDKGNRYYTGTGVVKKLEKAKDCYEKAWSFGDDTSGLFLGFLFLDRGFGENKLYNPALARTYFDSVCLSGSPIGNYGIGWMYQMGFEGFAKDIPQAISYYEKGAAKGDACCISSLHYIYSYETGFINREKAKEYYQQMIYLIPSSKRLICRPENL